MHICIVIHFCDFPTIETVQWPEKQTTGYSVWEVQETAAASWK